MDEKSEISTTMKVVFAFVAGVLITGGLALVTLRRHEAPPKTDVPQQSAMAAPSAPASSAPPVSPSIASPSPEPPQNVEPPAVPKPAPAKPRPSAFSKASAPAKTIATVAAAPLPQNPSGASSGDPAPDNAASAGSAQASQVGSAPATQVASAQQLPDLPAPQPVQNPPGQQAIYGAPQPPPQQPVNATPAPNVAPPPHTVTIAAGTNLVVRLAEELSSSRNTAGDAFRATLDQPVVLDGFIIADKGSAVRGKVVESQKAGHMTGKSELGLELTEINTTDGQTVYVRTSDVTRQGPNSTGENAAKVGGGAALGAIIGALAGGGKGAAIGAGAGGAAGTGVMLSTRGKPTKLPVETRLTFQLNEPVSITEQIRH
jgi:hypothetical protein